MRIGSIRRASPVLSSVSRNVPQAVAGPLAEIPFMQLGCWHYYSPDYFPFGQDLPGLSSLTGPCYFAVTQDAQALGRPFDEDM